MPIVSCVNCGQALTIPDQDLDKEILCTNCNTRQHPTFEPPPKPPAEVPPYILASFIVVTLYLAGIATLLFGLGAFFGLSPLIGLAIIAGGISTIAGAMILSFARQIARQTYNRALDT